jgi:hypothetical protein
VVSQSRMRLLFFRPLLLCLTAALAACDDSPSHIEPGDAGPSDDAGSSDADDAGSGDAGLSVDAGDAGPPLLDACLPGQLDSRIRYELAEVAPDEVCVSEVQTRACEDGVWSRWSGSYAQVTCQVREPRRCGELPSGEQESRVRYQSATVPFGATCTAETQTRSCHDGMFSDWTGKYVEDTCSPLPPRACAETPHGEEDRRTRYEHAEVPYGGRCRVEEQVRTCHDGTWSAYSGSYAFERCVVAGPAACGNTPSGETESRERYAVASVPHGGTCSVEVQTRTCENGTWSSWSGSFDHAQCHVERPRSCGDVPHGGDETRMRYAESEAHNRACTGETQRRTCQNGTFGTWSGSFAHEQCSRCEDADGDGHGPGCSQGPDCDDAAADVHPAASEVPWNHRDENCDGELGRRLEVVHRFDNRETNSDWVLFDRDYVVMFATQALEVRKRGALDEPLAVHPEFRGRPPYYLQMHGGVIVTDSGPDSHTARELVIHDFRDVTRPPRAVAQLPFVAEQPQFWLSLDGKRLHVFTDRARSYDLTDPAAPRLIGQLSFPFCGDQLGSNSLADSGRHVFFSCYNWSRGTSLWVMSDPSDPATSTWTLLRQANGRVRFDRALEHDAWWFRGEGWSELYDLDTSDPARPVARMRRAMNGSDEVLAATDDLVVRGRFGFRGDQALCVQRGTADEECVDDIELGMVYAVQGERLIIGGANHMSEYDISARPTLIGEWSSLPIVSGHGGAAVIVQQGVGYAASRAGLVMLDLREFREPVTVAGGSMVTSLVVEGGYAYLTIGGAAIIDVRDPFSPAPDVSFPGWFREGATVARRGGVSYLVGSTDRSLDAWRLSPPASPSRVGTLEGLPHAHTSRLVDDGQYLYSARSDGTIAVYSFDGARPTHLRSFGANRRDILPRDGALYWLDWDRLHVADPGTGQDVETISTGSGGLSHFWDMSSTLLISEGSVLRTYSWGRLWALDEEARSLQPVRLPAEAEDCSPVGAGEGLFLCDSTRGLYVLRVVD